MLRIVLLIILQTCILTESSAIADSKYFTSQREESKTYYVKKGSRSQKERITLYSLAAATLLTGAVAWYFAADAKSNAEEISATGIHTGKVWTTEQAAIYDDATDSRRISRIGFGISGALALGTMLTYLLTSPKNKTGYYKGTYILPKENQLLIGQGWRF